MRIGPLRFQARCCKRQLSLALVFLFVAHLACKKMGGGGGGHWLVRMEWRPAGWLVCLHLLIFPCTIKFRCSLLAPAHPGGPGKRAVKRLCVCVLCVVVHSF